MGVLMGNGVEVAGIDVLLGIIVTVYGKAVSVNGSVGLVVTVTPGKGVGLGVRVATLGTQMVSPEYIRSLVRQLTIFNSPAVM